MKAVALGLAASRLKNYFPSPSPLPHGEREKRPLKISPHWMGGVRG